MRLTLCYDAPALMGLWGRYQKGSGVHWFRPDAAYDFTRYIYTSNAWPFYHDIAIEGDNVSLS